MYRLIAETYNYIRSGAGTVTLSGIIWAVAAGFGIGIVLSYYNKNYLGETVRRLYKKGAVTKETALSLNEIGLSPTKIRTHALRKNGSLRKYIKVADEEAEERDADFSSVKLYIPEELKYKAIVRYEQKSRIPLVLLVASLLVLAAVAFGVTLAAPKILRVLDNFLTSIINK